MNYPRVITRVIAAYQAHTLAKRCQRTRVRLFKACPDLANGCARMVGKINARKNSQKVYRENVRTMNKLLGS